jgi:hypothetical protein
VTRDTGHGLLFLGTGLVVLFLGGCARLVDQMQARNRGLGIFLAVVALCFGGFIEIWTWGGAGLACIGVGLLVGGVGAILVMLGVLLIVVGLARLVIGYPSRQRRARSRWRNVRANSNH